MENERYYFRVGLFIIISMIFASIVFMWVANKGFKNRYITYAIYFEDSVNGLTRGSLVKLKGIDVGIVSDISFGSYHENKVLVLVEIVDTAPIRKDTVASIMPQGITGASIMNLENTGEDSEYLKKTKGQKYLVIKSKTSKIQEVFAKAPKLVENINKLTIQGQKLLNDQNIDYVSSSLIELHKLLIEAKAAVREIKMLGKTLREDPSKIIRKPKYEGYKID